MGVLEFISSLFWPATVLAIVLIFREPIKALLDGLRVEEMSAGPVRVKLAEALAERREELDAHRRAEDDQSVGPMVITSSDQILDRLKADLRQLPGPSREALSSVVDVVSTSPLAAIEAGYATVEAAVVRLVQTDGPVYEPDKLRAVQWFKLAEQRGVVDSSNLENLRELRLLRNVAVQDQDVTEVEALDYLMLVYFFLSDIEQPAD